MPLLRAVLALLNVDNIFIYSIIKNIMYCTEIANRVLRICRSQKEKAMRGVQKIIWYKLHNLFHLQDNYHSRKSEMDGTCSMYMR
jgi:hypothetical protein